MDTQTRVEKTVRLRSSEEPGTWLIMGDRRAMRSFGQDEIVSKRSSTTVRRGLEKMLKDVQAILNRLKKAPREAHEEEVLLVSSDDPKILDQTKLLLDLMVSHLASLQAAEMELLIEAMVPRLLELPSPGAMEQAKRNVEARESFMQQYEVLDAQQVHQLAGSKAKNRSALATTWRSGGRIFAVKHLGKLLYPAFQFDSQGRPKAILSKVLIALGGATGGWQAAIWFTTANSWLKAKKPIDLLDSEPNKVLDAATVITEPVIH